MMTRKLQILTILTCMWFAIQPYTSYAASVASSAQKFISISNEQENLVVSIDHVALMSRGSGQIGFAMSFALLGNALPRQERVYITPQLVFDDQVASFPSIEILGNWAYYHDLRTPQESHLVPDALQYRDREAVNYQTYHQVIDRQPWMDRATLRLIVERTDGCGNALKHIESVLRTPSPVASQNLNTQSVVVRTVDVQQLRGRAYVSFPVKSTDLLPDFRGNRRELERLKRTIDSVAGNPDIEILSIQVKGYASPEGSYETNARLARERTGSFARYIMDNTKVASRLFHTSSEAEDWEGLRNFVDSTSLLTHRSELLKLIDSDLYPDQKLSQIAARYPADYKVMSNVAFPLLRHTDYQIDYQLKKVTMEKGPDVPVVADTLWQLATDQPTDTMDCIKRHYSGFQPVLAVKTNLLYDLVLAPNIEVEVPFGRNRQWSVMAEYTNPWWRFGGLKHSYEIQEGGVELRRWLTPRCHASRPWLCGLFAGVYAAAAKYDIEYDEVGDQGEVFSAGATVGYSKPIGRRLNLEFSLSVGFLTGERRHYNAEFDDTHLIYKETKNLSYVGPTKLKVSLVWLIPWFKKKEK